MKVLRWLGVLPACAVALAAGWVVSQAVVGLADARCPEASQIAGVCVAAWHTDWVSASVYVGLGVAVVLAVVLPMLLAPNLKRWAAALGILLVMAAPAGLLALARWGELLPPLVFVLLVGLAGMFLMPDGIDRRADV